MIARLTLVLLAVVLSAYGPPAPTGGEVVNPWRTALRSDVVPRATTITVKDRLFTRGDQVFLSTADGEVEFMEVLGDATGRAGAYTYPVKRDLDGTGPNNWRRGKAVRNTGRSPTLDLFVQR